jgi:hypothetical protein
MQANLNSGYRLYSENVSTANRPAWIAPAGEAFKHVYNDVLAAGITPENAGNSFSNLYTSDGSHPSIYGSYLTTCVLHATITGDSPVGNTRPNGISASFAMYLQEAAAATVFNETSYIYYPWMRAPPTSSTTFSNGDPSVILHPALNESTEITNRPGQRIDEAEMNVTASGLQMWSNTTNGMQLMAPNSTMIGTTVDTSNQLRLNNSGGGSVPNAGTNNTVISSPVSMSGNHSYDTLHLLCGIASCGEITSSGGPLRIYANVIKIELGTAIIADEMVLGNYGSGSSTSRGTNGKSPGAGGGGHGAQGGSGGGTNGGSGGTNYGNGSEPGSSGGNVTFTNSNGQTSNDANGGYGGGVIELFAREIYLNGTLSANGGRGDNGATPPGGSGPGGSGAGGGSGGSIALLSNIIYIGGNAVLSAEGGDGGDGEDGNCAPGNPCLFMYDGGHGGGGGAGGIILLISMAGQLTNNGAISVAGGGGGLGGAPYGTGVAGSVGTAGSNGFSGPGTFAGWTGSVSYIYNGNFTSPVFGQVGLKSVEVKVSVPHNEPLNTSIIATYKYSLDGSNWSPWLSFNLSGDVLPAFALLQFNMWLSTTNNTTTPTVSSININASNWNSIDDFSLAIANTTGSNEFWYFQKDFGVVRNVTSIASPGSTVLRSFVPTNATPVGSAWIHVIPPMFFSDTDIDFRVNGTNLLTINSSEIPSIGITIELNYSFLQMHWPTVPFTTNGSAGIAWSNLEVRCSAPGGWMGSFNSDFVIIPYRLTERLGGNGSILASINEHVNVTSGRWAEASFATFPVISSGSALDVHGIELSDLWINFIDDIIPEVSDISFYVDGAPITYARVGDLVEIRVSVLGNESDATIDWYMEGLSVISSWPPASTATMSWDTLHNVYVGFYDTGQHSSEYGDSMALWLWMEDAAGNVRNPSGVSAWYEALILKPVFPELETMQVSGCETVVVAICEVEAGTEITFAASALEERTDLDVFAYIINPSDSEEEFVTQLSYDEVSKLYMGKVSLTSAEFGWWDILFRAIDINQNEGNWSEPEINMIHLIDSTAPSERNLQVTNNPTASQSWAVYGEWLATLADNSSATLHVSGPNDYSLTTSLSKTIANDSQAVSSYVALGSTETMGLGASNANNSTIGLIHNHLNQTWPGVELTNISNSWGAVQDFIAKKDDIIAANPDIITLIPLRDYSSSSTSVWQTSYPILLDNLVSTGAQIYIGVVHLDPDYVCHINSGPAGCHTYGAYQVNQEKNKVIYDIAATRPWVTLIPLSDDGPTSPEWKDENGYFTDAGHHALAEAMLHGIRGARSSYSPLFGGTHLLDTSSLSPGVYDFEIEVVDEYGNIAPDFVSGPDATMSLLPPDGVLTFAIQTPVPTTLHPGMFEVSYDAMCSIGCSMQLEVSLDGEIIEVIYPTGGAGNYLIDIPSIGAHTISMTLSTSDWVVPSSSDSLEVFATPPPAPEWHISCSYFDEEITQIGIAYNGGIGNLTTSTHFVNCAVTNSGGANGFVQLSPNSTVGPFVCTSSVTEVTPAGRAEFYCNVEESDSISGIHSLSIGFEEVIASGNNSIGGWETNAVLLSPRFATDGVVDDDEKDPQDDANADVAGKSPIVWIISALALLLVGIGAITLLFSLRDRKVPIIGEYNEESLFGETSDSDIESVEAAYIHPSIVENNDGGEIVDEEITAEPSSDSEVDSTISRGQVIESYLNLPSGGDYEQADGVTIYKQADGVKWQMEDGGSFRRLD